MLSRIYRSFSNSLCLLHIFAFAHFSLSQCSLHQCSAVRILQNRRLQFFDRSEEKEEKGEGRKVKNNMEKDEAKVEEKKI